MKRVLLINPNTSQSTTRMMAEIAQAAMPAGVEVIGLTSPAGPPMILQPHQLQAAAPHVLEVALAHGGGADGIIVGAFGDPGLDLIQQAMSLPAAGICESSMLAAATGGRRFGIATVTPDLADVISDSAFALGLGPSYTGIRLTDGDPQALASDPEALEDALAGAVRQCLELDGAEAVIIGGGPLGQAAIGLTGRFPIPIIAPIPAAVKRICALAGFDKLEEVSL